MLNRSPYLPDREVHRHNWLRLPLVIFIRLPLLIPLFLLSVVGEIAQRVGDSISRSIPGLKTDSHGKVSF